MDNQLLIESFNEPVVILDVDQGNFVDCNEKATSFFKLSKKKLLSKNPSDLSPANVYGHNAQAYARRVIQEALAGGNPVFDWVHIDKDGHEIPCEVRLIRFPPFSKNLVRGTILDMTQKEPKEAILRESEERLRLALEATDIGTFDWYPQENKVFWDERIYKIFELAPSTDVDLNAHLFSIVHPHDIERVGQEFETTLQDHGPDSSQVEYRVLVNGKTKFIQSFSKVIRNDKGQAIRLLGTSQDITPLRESEEKFKKSEERLRNVFNQQFQYSTVLNLDGKIVQINDLLLKMDNQRREDLIGKYLWKGPWWEGNREWQQKIKQQVLMAKTSEGPILTEDRFFSVNKDIRYTNSSYQAINDVNGKAINILVQAIDITSEKEARQSIEVNQKQLSLIYNSVTDFMLLMRVEKAGFFIESVNKAAIEGMKNVGIDINEASLAGLNMLTYFEDILRYTPSQIKEHFEVYNRVKKSKQSIRYTTEAEYNGTFLATDTTATPIIESNEVKFILTVTHDITEITQSKFRLEQALGEVKTLKEQIEQENVYLKEEIKQANDFENMVFRSSEFNHVLKQVEQVAKTDATVLITGETGTGKELIARAIHNVSTRSEKPMIKVNTAAIPRELIESELFGYEKGAFTGAIEEKPGKFELADGGSIFLDEIGDMPLELQVKILRILQEGEVERLGSTQSRKIDVRVISATNKDLNALIEKGAFREDLLFRLKVFPIEIPPLRSRPNDIPALVEHFVNKYSSKHDKPVNMVPKSVMDYLRNYAWPGNVRELENTIERAIILSNSEHLSIPEILNDNPSQIQEWSHDDSLNVIQENHIRKILIKCGWRIEGKNGASNALKIKPSTLRDKMKKFGIKRPNT
ncbi:sigma 54-interacting transcriptional regulator [Ekhidna sp.]|uniref:sigma 54-interacting transcriptional regulator n=1 Tax=Ekhidna sp. TaxID=2608089 RepID=UPI003BAD2A73